jgi:hypothetical protein
MPLQILFLCFIILMCCLIAFMAYSSDFKDFICCKQDELHVYKNVYIGKKKNDDKSATINETTKTNFIKNIEISVQKRTPESSQANSECVSVAKRNPYTINNHESFSGKDFTYSFTKKYIPFLFMNRFF